MHSNLSSSTVVCVRHARFKCCCTNPRASIQNATVRALPALLLFYQLCKGLWSPRRLFHLVHSPGNRIMAHSNCAWRRYGSVTPLFAVHMSCVTAPRTHSDFSLSRSRGIQTDTNAPSCTLPQTHQTSIFYRFSSCLVYSWALWNVLQCIYKPSLHTGSQLRVQTATTIRAQQWKRCEKLSHWKCSMSLWEGSHIEGEGFRVFDSSNKDKRYDFEVTTTGQVRLSLSWLITLNKLLPTSVIFNMFTSLE